MQITMTDPVPLAEIDVWKEMYERQDDVWAMAHDLQHVCETQRVTIELLKAKLK